VSDTVDTPTRNAKEEVRALLDRLPDHVSLQDILYHIEVLERIRRGIESLDREGGVPHDEVVRRFEDKWRTR
jgi:uncharacterized NAD-dependent epimerase/dehydratase family protein